MQKSQARMRNVIASDGENKTERMKNNEQSKAKKIYNVASTVVVALIFVFMIVVVAVMLIQKNSGGESKIFGYYMYDVLTDSMSGTIEPGDVIMCKAVKDVNELQEGDIITFKAPNGNYNETHRIIEIARNEDGSIKYFKTKGDNAKEADGWELKPENVKAKYVKTSVFIGGLRRFMKHWYGYVVVVVVPLCVVFALIIAGFVKDKVALEGEKEKEKAINISDISDEDKRKLLEKLVGTKNLENTSENGDNAVENLEQGEENRIENEESGDERSVESGECGKTSNTKNNDETED